MKVVILAGGFGTRLSEETHLRPKPMVEIGDRPILWHIMKIYSHYGYNDFVILLGYKGSVIKEYFCNYFIYSSDFTIEVASNSIEVHNRQSEAWKVTLVDTGVNTLTGGRILRAQAYLQDAPFMLTYGDGLADVNLDALLAFHSSHSGIVTMTAVRPEGKYGHVKFQEGSHLVYNFNEKPPADGEDNFINGGFFVCDPEVFSYLEGNDTPFETRPLQRLSAERKLYAYQHVGFWRCMDTLRDCAVLNNMWQENVAPWRMWGK